MRHCVNHASVAGHNSCLLCCSKKPPPKLDEQRKGGANLAWPSQQGDPRLVVSQEEASNVQPRGLLRQEGCSGLASGEQGFGTHAGPHCSVSSEIDGRAAVKPSASMQLAHSACAGGRRRGQVTAGLPVKVTCSCPHLCFRKLFLNAGRVGHSIGCEKPAVPSCRHGSDEASVVCHAVGSTWLARCL